jgi:4-hydroxy-tetrahydrodipicolinate reductase
LRIGVFGKGRLGAAIAKEAGAALAWQVARESPPAEGADCAIEASSGAAVRDRLAWAIAAETPLVIGSTGWEIPELRELVGERIGVLVAPNFSLTVALYAKLAAVLGRFAATSADKDPYVIEHHHARKHDAPSGTAKMLARVLMEACPRKTEWVVPHHELGPLRPHQLSVSPVRAGVTYSSHVVGIDAPGETIELHHAARDASPYAHGALAAARWLASGRRGVFGMQDVARELLRPLFEEIA